MIQYFLFRLWDWVIDHGLPLAALLIVALLVPRLGRLGVRLMSRQLTKGDEATKTRLALIGALVYMVEAVAFFFIVLLALTNLGVPATGAAIPATVVSAAIGFGAQNVIGDFLAGFFIISERQFGLGDYVSFDGTNTPVEGTVVALTLRATRLRTPSGELVNVPNGTTGVITNFSQEWSRALVDIQIPMKRGESMDVLTRKVEDAAKKAVREPNVARDVTNELEVLPAMELVQPVAAGQPWSVKYRITADVNPARQWAVERAIRSAVANVFWDRMQQAPVFGSSENNDVVDDATAVAPTKISESPKRSTSGGDGPGAPAYSNEESAEVMGASLEDGAEEDPMDKIFERPQYDSKIKNFLSVGGRTRASTTMLIISLFVVGGLALFSANPEGAQAGFLNPARWENREKPAETTETTPPPPTTPTSEQTSENQEQPSQPAEQTTEQPEQQYSPQSSTPRQSSETTRSSEPTPARETAESAAPTATE